MKSGVEGCLTPNMAEGEINIDNLIQRLLEGKRYFLIFMDFLKVNTAVIAMFSKG